MKARTIAEEGNWEGRTEQTRLAARKGVASAEETSRAKAATRKRTGAEPGKGTRAKAQKKTQA